MVNPDGENEAPKESHKPSCPNCGSTDIRVSQTQRMLDFLLKSFSLLPQRCRSCRKRFYLRKSAEADADIDEDAADSNVNP